MVGIISISYFFYLLNEMESHTNDIVKSQHVSNTFKDGTKDFNMTDFGYLPSFEVRYLNGA